MHLKYLHSTDCAITCFLISHPHYIPLKQALTLNIKRFIITSYHVFNLKFKCSNSSNVIYVVSFVVVYSRNFSLFKMSCPLTLQLTVSSIPVILSFFFPPHTSLNLTFYYYHHSPAPLSFLSLLFQGRCSDLRQTAASETGG